VRLPGYTLAPHGVVGALVVLALTIVAAAPVVAAGEDARAFVAQGDQHRKDGAPERALAEYEKALALDDSNPDVYGRIGHALLESGNPERAMKMFQRQIVLAPKDCEARAGLGFAYLAQGLPDQAVRACEDALKLCPEDARAYSNLGRAYQSANYPIEAIEAFRRALELDASDLPSHESLAKLYFQRKLFPEAAGAYEALLARADLGKDEAWSASARERLGFIYRWVGSCEQAVPHWEAAVASSAAETEVRARALEGLAGCRAELGQTARAIELFQRLVAEQPKRAAHYYRLGDLLNEAGRPTEALQIAKQGKGVDGPCPAEAFCLMGRAYEKLGGIENYHRAEREFQQAVACGDPRFTEYAQQQADRQRALVNAEDPSR
jgi:tetratricopeptide (TPR) repeat protein